MTFEMIDCDKRLTSGKRQSLGRGEADDDPADKARPRRASNAVEIGETDICMRQRAADQPVKHINMGTRRDLRDDATKGRMFGDLAHHLIGENFAAARTLPKTLSKTLAQLHDSGRRFIACGFDPENAHMLALKLYLAILATQSTCPHPNALS
jgi:hypothetical protein